MSIKEITGGVLSVVGLVGILVLYGLGKDVSVFLPIEGLLVGWIVGVKTDAILGVFKKK